MARPSVELVKIVVEATLNGAESAAAAVICYELSAVLAPLAHVAHHGEDGPFRFQTETLRSRMREVCAACDSSGIAASGMRIGLSPVDFGTHRC